MTITKRETIFDEQTLTIKEITKEEYKLNYSKLANFLFSGGIILMIFGFSLGFISIIIALCAESAIMSVLAAILIIIGIIGTALCYIGIGKITDEEDVFYKEHKNYNDKNLGYKQQEAWLEKHPLVAAYQKAHKELSLYDAWLITEQLKKD